MHLRSVIIDDEITGIDILKLLIEKHLPDVKVVGQATRGGDAIELIGNYMPDIVFLDISMPEMDGFELLEKLAWKNFHLVFTTAYQEHALRALKQDAMDYLLKPVDQKDLCAAVGKIKSQIAAQREAAAAFATLNDIGAHYSGKLAVNSKQSVEFLDPAEIIYLESRSNYTLIHLSHAEPILTPKTLRDFDQQLCNNQQFMRVHNSFVVNLHKVLRYIKDQDMIVMVNQEKVPLSKSRKTVFFKWLEAY